MNLQVIASPDGEILWVSDALPGAVRDPTPGQHQGHYASGPRRRQPRPRLTAQLAKAIHVLQTC
jgi:hypothetical protein